MLVSRLHQGAEIKIYEDRIPKPPPPALPPSTAEEFRSALKSGKPTLVDFGSNHCIPCIQLRPVLKALKDEYSGRINIMMIEINDNRDLAREYRIQLIPTLIFFNSEGKEVGRALGYMDKEAIKKKFQEFKIG
jgi:thioredoxin 1